LKEEGNEGIAKLEDIKQEQNEAIEFATVAEPLEEASDGCEGDIDFANPFVCTYAAVGQGAFCRPQLSDFSDEYNDLENYMKMRFNMMMDEFSGGVDFRQIDMREAEWITGWFYTNLMIDLEDPGNEARLHEH